MRKRVSIVIMPIYLGDGVYQGKVFQPPSTFHAQYTHPAMFPPLRKFFWIDVSSEISKHSSQVCYLQILSMLKFSCFKILHDYDQSDHPYPNEHLYSLYKIYLQYLSKSGSFGKGQYFRKKFLEGWVKQALISVVEQIYKGSYVHSRLFCSEI